MFSMFSVNSLLKSSILKISKTQEATRDFDKGASNFVRFVRGASLTKSFTDNLNGTVTDNNTGLIRQQAACADKNAVWF